VETLGALPPLSGDAELALFRALQEALSNVARHAEATVVNVRISGDASGVRLAVRDDGRAQLSAGALEGRGRMGLAGMRERITALGGTLSVRAAPEGGVELVVTLTASAPTA
jgi:signal transduction histidine kinase